MVVYDAEQDRRVCMDMIRGCLERGDESWSVGQLILHAQRRRRIPMAALAAGTGVSAYRLRRVRDGYLRHVGGVR